MATPDLSGKYKLKRNSENFVNYLEANGLNLPMRTAASKAPFKLEVVQDGDSFKLILKSLVFEKADCFKIGERIDKMDHFGNPHQSYTTIEDGKVHSVLDPLDNSKGLKQTVRDISLEGTTLTIALKYGDIECQRIFEKES